MNLLTWNVQWCCGNDGTVSPARIVDTARAMGNFDVLCLQEIAVNYPRLAGDAGHDQPALLRELLPGYQLFFGAAVDEFHHDGRQQFGNLIATRLPVLQVQHHPLPYPADAGVRSMPRMCTVVTVLDPQLGPVRVMTTHLEFYSRRQRMAQVMALGDLHKEYCLHTEALPKSGDDGSPFQTRVHTRAAILCGDFNFDGHEAEYAVMTATQTMGQWWDCWRLLHGDALHAPTFHLHDRTHAPEPVASDFVFVSDALKDHVQHLAIDSATQASDHQPVAVALG